MLLTLFVTGATNMHESTTKVMPQRSPDDGTVLATATATPDAGGPQGSITLLPSEPVGSVGPQVVGAVLEIRARAGARGAGFTGYGYLTEVARAPVGDLFAGSADAVSGSLFTAYLDVSVVQARSRDLLGELTVFQRSGPGASFADLSSFTAGRVVAAYDLTLHGPVNLRGGPVTGVLVQTHAGRLDAGLRGLRFGRRGARLQVVVSELDTAVDPLTRNTQWEIATTAIAA